MGDSGQCRSSCVSYDCGSMEIIQTATFRKWREGLRDQRAQGFIAARLLRLSRGMLGDTAPVGDGVDELRIHHGPGYRLYFLPHGSSSIVLLCAGDKNRRRATLVWQDGSPVNGDKIMAEKFYPYDPAEALETFVADAFETGDSAHIAAALGVVARAKGMSALVIQTGMSREQLDQSLSAIGNPTLETTLAVMKAFGMGVGVTTRAPNG